MILAEAVSIDGGALVAILAVFVLIVALWCALAVRGFWWARAAGSGSRAAMTKWVASAVAITLPMVISPMVVVPVVLVALQARLYVRAKQEHVPEGWRE